MKVSCIQENLAKGLTIVIKAVAIRPTLPILTNVLLATEKGRLKIASTDLEVGITTWVGAKIEQEGSITVPARVLTEFVQSVRDETITLEVVETRLAVKSHHQTAEIAGQPANEFPIIPTVKRESTIRVAAAIFREGIRQVVFATALDETRPALTALAIRCQDSQAKLVATDSYRLSEKTIALSESVKTPITLLVPARTGHELERLIDSTIDQVEIVSAENQALFRFGSIELVSRLIDGQYPEYEAIIPKQPTTTVVCAVATLTDALKSSLIFARESANQVSLSISEDQPNQFVIAAQSGQLGRNTAIVPATTTGPALSITFNAKFILDVLGVINSEKVELGFNESTNPLIIKPDQSAGYLAVVMPLKS